MNVDASGVSRDIGGAPAAAGPVAEVLVTINPGMQYEAGAVAAPAVGTTAVAAAAAARPRNPSLGSRAASRIWTVDSFDESAGMPADRPVWGTSVPGHGGEVLRPPRLPPDRTRSASACWAEASSRSCRGLAL